jgi:hypothetical protein
VTFKVGDKVIVASFHYDPSMVDYKIGTIAELPIKERAAFLFYRVQMSDNNIRSVFEFQISLLSPVIELLYTIEE